MSNKERRRLQIGNDPIAATLQRIKERAAEMGASDGSGSDYITREGAELMFTQMLAKYEKDVITPRHDESRTWHLEVVTMLAARKGRREVFTAVASGAGIFWTCIEIWKGVHK